ncbi:MAG TPA: DUF2911 domain-containing protein [Mucilaginibacter sp.]|jgi:hypothetical protein|nr:DUF2911 domain-containing protein [Mucilaginibacter sp.]
MMKTLFRLTALSFLVLVLFAPSAVSAQDSPRENVSGSINGAKVTIGYGSPSVRGRKIWGGLVPYGQIWRTGANPVTEIQTDKDLKIEGKTLPAGKYSIFTVPGENEWKVIFNSETGQWGIKGDGSANDDPSKDVLTVTVKPKKSPGFHEKLTFTINKGDFTLLWENLAVPVAAN